MNRLQKWIGCLIGLAILETLPGLCQEERTNPAWLMVDHPTGWYLIDRIATDPNPREIVYDLSLVEAPYDGCLRSIWKNLKGQDAKATFGAWKVDTTTWYWPKSTDPNEDQYQILYNGFWSVDLQKKDNTFYTGTLAGSVAHEGSDQYPSPQLEMIAVSGRVLQQRCDITPLYQTGKKKEFLGESKVVTIHRAGCYYMSLGMLVASYFGESSVHYKHWQDMDWMVDQGCFTGPNLIGSIAARKLGMKYLELSGVSQKNMEYVYQRGWRAIVFLNSQWTHFVFCVPVVGIAADGRVIWDVIIDPQKNNEDKYVYGPDGIWGDGRTLPRLTTNPCYYNRLGNTRVFAIDNDIEASSPDPPVLYFNVPYKLTQVGWWRQKAGSRPQTYASSEELAGLRGLNCQSAEGIKIAKVATPCGEIVEEGYLKNSPEGISLRQTAMPDESEVEPPDEERFSEFYAGNLTPAGLYTFFLEGTPLEEWQLAVAWFDAAGELTTFRPSGTFDADGKACWEFDFQPGVLDLEGLYRPAETLVDMAGFVPSQKVSYSAPLVFSDSDGFFLHNSDDPRGVRINWPGGTSASPGTWVRVFGAITAVQPEIVIEADDPPEAGLVPLDWSPAVVMPAKWQNPPLPYCRLVKVVDRAIANDGCLQISNGNQTLAIDNFPPAEAAGLDGRMIAITGILRPDRLQYISDYFGPFSPIEPLIIY